MQVLFLWDSAGSNDAALAEQVGSDADLANEERRVGLQMANESMPRSTHGAPPLSWVTL